MHCKVCGQVIDDDSRFCQHCGATQSAPELAQQTVVRPAPPEIGKPSKPNKVGQAVGIGLAVIIGLAAIGQCSTSPDANSNITMADDPTMTTDVMPSSTAPTAEATAGEKENWAYSTDEDKLRGATTFHAQTASTNEIQQDAPYSGGTRMTLSLRKHPRWGTDVMLSISEGQMMCPSYNGCDGMVRFDNGPARKIRFNGPEDNSSEVIFVKGAQAFVSQIKKAKHMTIEKTIYQAGAPQFEFDVSGLKWSH